MKLAITTVFAAAAISFAHAPPAQAAGTTQVVALTGDAAPDGNGALATILQQPTLNDSGQAAFIATLSGTGGGADDDTGAFRAGTGGLAQIARKGQAVPDGAGFFFEFDDPPLINEAGQVMFDVDLSSAIGGPNDIRDSVYRGDGVTLVKIARPGDPAPDGNGTIPVSFSGLTGEVFNDAGQAGMRVLFENTTGAPDDDRGIYVGGGGPLTRIVRKGQAAPDGNGVVSAIQGVAINNSGLAAAGVNFSGTSGGAADDSAILLGDGTTLTRLVRDGDAAPDGNGVFSGFQDFGFNDAGQIGFTADLTGTADGADDDRGVFRADGTPAGLIQIAREGQAPPNGDGTFSEFGRLALNNSGQALFSANLAGATSGVTGGIFRGDGSSLINLFNFGDQAPDGNGTFFLFSAFALNDAGQSAAAVGFSGTSGGSSDDRAIVFFEDSLGLLQVAREGDALLGSTIVDLGFVGSIGAGGDENSGFNELGQIAYRFTLADGREGVALWTVPEPASIALTCLGAIGLATPRRRLTIS